MKAKPCEITRPDDGVAVINANLSMSILKGEVVIGPN
jgi:hypothetical protein